MSFDDPDDPNERSTGDFWSSTSGADVGDIFPDMPPVSHPAVLFRQFHGHWWFYELVPRDAFHDGRTFDELFRVADGRHVDGWFAVPPQGVSPTLPERAMIHLCWPIILSSTFVEAAEMQPVASLDSATYSRLCAEFRTMFEET